MLPLAPFTPALLALAPTIHSASLPEDPAALRRLIHHAHRAIRTGHRLAAERGAAQLPPLGADPATVAAQDAFDALHYAIDLAIDPAPTTRHLDGFVDIVLQPTGPSLDQVMLNLDQLLQVEEVLRGDGAPQAFVHQNNELEVLLDPPLGAGTRDTLRVLYGGSPNDFDFRGLDIFRLRNFPVVWTLSEPNMAREWWPCKDRPDDKATVELHIRMPDRYVVASNGLLEAVDDHGDGTATHHWRTQYLLPTYLVALTATNFVLIEDSYSLIEGGTLPLDYYTWPTSEERARIDVANIPSMMRAYELEYAPYPFAAEKYGHMEAPIWGAMEHTTMTTYGTWLYSGDNSGDFVAAHELSHHWWGNTVTCGTWKDIWLNEGFATYSEAIWAETIGGYQSYLDYMSAIAAPSFPGPVYDPDHTFNNTVYEKGAWILHMLRGILGRDELIEVLRVWYAAYEHQSPVTADFVALVEDQTGQEMDWFFDPWLYEPGRPSYRYALRLGALTGERTLVDFEIEQVQGGVNPYTMPITLRLTMDDASTRDVVVFNAATHEHLETEVDGIVVAAEPDPDHYILAGFAPMTWKGLTELPAAD